jgi:hypothetical protein
VRREVHAPAKANAEATHRRCFPVENTERDYSRHRDVVSVTIFEAEAGGLFLPSEADNFITLPEQTVDSNGNIMVPYAGTIRAAGRTPSEVQQAVIEDRILKGEKPADLPVQAPTSTSWCRTSRPRRPSGSSTPTLLARADEVIELMRS